MSGGDRTDWHPRPATLALVDAARDVIDEAEDQGYKLTLRAVYYGLVSVNAIANNERSYKRLSEVLNRARWAGLLDMTAIDDLQRVVVERPAWDDAADFAAAVVPQYRTDWWADGSTRVEVWAEKAAVASIVGPEAHRFGVPFMACRGYASLTALAEAGDRWDFGGPDRTVILYVGDLDPSGADMDRDIGERLEELAVTSVEVRRLALTRTQVDDHSLPPNPTKLTDSRAANWTHGRDSWELDALPAPVLAGLVRDALADLAPADFDERQAEDKATRRQLARRMAV